MGGNVSVMSSNGEVRADIIDFNKIDRVQFTIDMVGALRELSQECVDVTGQPIWESLNNEVFSGSAAHIFDSSISVSDIKEHKPVMGDIDIMVDENKKQNVWNFLDQLSENQYITPFVRYVGNNRPTYSEKSKQINSIFLWRDHRGEEFNIQIDFEFLPFRKIGKVSVPTNWSTFSHSSSWDDVVHGIKGVHHKFLLRAIAQAISARPDYLVMTPTATPEKPRVKKLHKVPTELKFSVDLGLRWAYQLQYIEKEEVEVSATPWKIDEQYVVKEKPVADSNYHTNIDDIFEMLFSAPVDEFNLSGMESFVGLTDLIEQYMVNNEIESVFKILCNLWWGKWAQALVRNDPEADLQLKSKAATFFINRFAHAISPQTLTHIEIMTDQYYDHYRMDEVA